MLGKKIQKNREQTEVTKDDLVANSTLKEYRNQIKSTPQPKVTMIFLEGYFNDKESYLSN